MFYFGYIQARADIQLGRQAFWAIQLFGGCAVAVNCWLSTEGLVHCLKITDTVIAIIDIERAQQLKNEHEAIKKLGCRKVLVSQAVPPNGHMQNLEEALARYNDTEDAPAVDIEPEDDCSIFMTSGTTGFPKAVLSTQRMFITNLFTLSVAGRRAILRRGEDIPVPSPEDPQKVLLLPVPLFHVTGKCNLIQRIDLAHVRHW